MPTNDTASISVMVLKSERSNVPAPDSQTNKGLYHSFLLEAKVLWKSALFSDE